MPLIIVCNHDASVCMVHRCEKRPGIGPVEQYLKNQIQQKDRGTSEDLVNNDDDFKIDFQQWMTTDCTQLITFIDKLQLMSLFISVKTLTKVLLIRS